MTVITSGQLHMARCAGKSASNSWCSAARRRHTLGHTARQSLPKQAPCWAPTDRRTVGLRRLVPQPKQPPQEGPCCQQASLQTTGVDLKPLTKTSSNCYYCTVDDEQGATLCSGQQKQEHNQQGADLPLHTPPWPLLRTAAENSSSAMRQAWACLFMFHPAQHFGRSGPDYILAILHGCC